MAVRDIVPVPGASFEETLASASPDVLREMIQRVRAEGDGHRGRGPLHGHGRLLRHGLPGRNRTTRQPSPGRNLRH